MPTSQLTQRHSKTPLSIRVWFSTLIFGLFGQVAWIVENMYFNVFMDRTVTTNPFAIQLMVALSAVFATLATLLAGVISDRIGKRKVIISWGYIVWGITVMAFAFISVDNTIKLLGIPRASAITVTVAIIIIMDCIMSIVGSSANDAAYNAWVTDITDTTNRGVVEGVLAVMPILAMAVVFGGFDWMTADKFLYADGSFGSVYTTGATLVSHGNWQLFFIVLGAITSIIGLVGLALIKDKKELVPNRQSKLSEIWYGFKVSIIKENKQLYTTYTAMAIIGIANMSFIPYLIIYAERTLGYANYIIPVAIIIVTSAIFSVIMGMQFDKYGKQKFIIPMAAIYTVGAIAMMLASPMVFGGRVPMALVAIAGFVLMSGNLSISAIMTAMVRDLTPKDKVGLFQGVRMVFWVLIPMIIGPLITAIITVGSKPVGLDYYGAKIYQYPPYMFAVAAAIMLANIPLLHKLSKYKSVQDIGIAQASNTSGANTHDTNNAQ